MNYIYDIVLNFNKEYYNFFEWNKRDNIVNVKKIPLFLVNNDTFKMFKYDNVTVSSDFINLIKDKTYTYSRIKIGNTSLITNGKEVIFDNNSSLIMDVNEYKFKIDINSFFQVNLDILGKVIDILRENSYGVVADLYCGVGTLGIPLKKDKLYGIEIVKEAVIDAIYNAKINKQDNKYMLGSAEVISKINDKIDTIIIDPPRAGLNKKTLDFLVNYKSRNLIYMSCNPFTLARDLSILKDIYEVNDVYYLDMFPKTKHMECLCVLKLK